jgi:hypothetical protein
MISAVFPSYKWYTVPSPTTHDINDIELHSSFGLMAANGAAAGYHLGDWLLSPIPNDSLNLQGISGLYWYCLVVAVAPNGDCIGYDWGWHTMSCPTSQDLNDLYIGDISFGICVGNQVLLNLTSFNWQILNPGYTANWKCVWGNIDKTSEMWIGGSGGKILKRLGSNWTQYLCPTSATITGIAFTTPPFGYACSDTGQIFKYDGSVWSLVSQPNTIPLNSIWLADATHGFAVGNNGRIMQFDGTNWTIYPNSPTTKDLNTVSMVDNTFGFIGGDDGVLLKYGLDDSVEATTLGNIKASFVR